MTIKSINSTVDYVVGFTAVPDELYGSGQDGVVTIATNTTLSRDMYYDTLTIAEGVHVNTNGFRVFVRNSLNLSPNLATQSTTSIGLKNGSSVVGTLAGGSTTSATNSLGGNSASYSVTGPTPTNYFNLPRNAVVGYTLHASQTTPLPLKGGAGDGTNPGGGVVVVCARKTYGYGTIYATGYYNGSTYTTGGGVIIWASQVATGTNVTFSTTGYASGTTKTFTI